MANIEDEVFVPKRADDVLTQDRALRLEYPYLWGSDEDDRLWDAFEDLKTMDLEIVKQDFIIESMTIHGHNKWDRYGNVVITKPWDDTDRISSYFNEYVRVGCKRSTDKFSPKEYWEKNKKTLVRNAQLLTSAGLNADVWTIVRGCGMFRPSLITKFITLLKAKSVLDFSAGWADRLIGTIAMGDVRYVGVDPNSDLVDPFNRIVSTFASDKTLYTLIPEPFQTAGLPEGETYDLVFTSPPYFNLEIYNNDLTQSYRQGVSVNDWLTTFLFPSLDKAWGVLNDNGTMVIIINDTKHDHYTDAMLQYMKTLSDRPVNLIPYSEGVKQSQPMWIWTKHRTSSHFDNELSPDVQVVSYVTSNNVTVSVVRDDLLIGGTKQRALIPFLETIDTHEIVYAGPDTGYAQLAISYACSILGKKAVLFIQSVGSDPTTSLTKDAIKYGANVHMMPAKLSIVQAEAHKYAARTLEATRLPFGMSDPIYQYLMVKALSKAINFPEPKRVWTAVGSMSLIRVLATIWHTTHFMAVQVGYVTEVTDLPYYLRDRITVIKVPESEYKFRDPVKHSDLPPYPSARSYDAKAWKYVNKQAQDGDYIWNVGA